MGSVGLFAILDRYLSNFPLSCSTCFWVEVFMSSSSLMLNGRVL